MQRRKKILISIVIAIALIIFAPWLSGLWFAKTYRNLITFINTQGIFKIEVTQYDRGWFHSRAKMHVEVVDPSARQIWQTLNFQNTFLSTFVFTIDQDIQHGPIIYQYAPGFSSLFGLAAIHDQAYLLNDHSQTLALPPLDTWVTFNGMFILKHLRIAQFGMSFPDSHLHIQFNNGIQGKLCLGANQSHVCGNLNFSNIHSKLENQNLSITSAGLRFDQYLGKSGLWLGNLSLVLPEVMWRDSSGEEFSASGIYFKTYTEESSVTFNGRAELNIEKLQLADQVVSPLHLKLTISGIDAQKLANLFTAYLKILRTGELYESQLKEKMLYLLPQIINPGSRFKIDTLDLTTTFGKLELDGEVNWPNHSSVPERLFEVLQASNAQVNLRIDKSMIDEVLQVVSENPFFYRVSIKEKQKLIDAEANARISMQRNTWLIASLVGADQLSEETGLNLLNLQNIDLSLENYANVIKSLYLNKQISRELSYLLFSQYAIVQQNLARLENAVDSLQKDQKQKMTKQINQWIKNGYIVQDKNNYIVKAVWDQKQFKINGHLVN